MVRAPMPEQFVFIVWVEDVPYLFVYKQDRVGVEFS